MYKAIITDGGLMYDNEDLKDVLDKLHQYLSETIGINYKVYDHYENKYDSVYKINKPGYYRIESKKETIYLDILYK